jgi:hypothetical protein
MSTTSEQVPAGTWQVDRVHSTEIFVTDDDTEQHRGEDRSSVATGA